MRIDRLKQMQINAIEKHNEYLSTITQNSAPYIVGQMTFLDIAANMNEDNIIAPLKEWLSYKKQISIKMLECENEQEINQLSEVIRHVDNNIKKLLGIYTRDRF
jgi:hypothetical protein